MLVGSTHLRLCSPILIDRLLAVLQVVCIHRRGGPVQLCQMGLMNGSAKTMVAMSIRATTPKSPPANPLFTCHTHENLHTKGRTCKHESVHICSYPQTQRAQRIHIHAFTHTSALLHARERTLRQNQKMGVLKMLLRWSMKALSCSAACSMQHVSAQESNTSEGSLKVFNVRSLVSCTKSAAHQNQKMKAAC